MAKEKKEDKKRNPEAYGVVGLTLGIVSIITLIFSPFMGILLSIIGFIFCIKQQKKERTKAARIGIILNVIGLVLNIAMIIVNYLWLTPYLNQIYQQQINGSLGYP